MPKPTDFYVTVIDFFGALIPGAVLMCLYAHALAALADIPILASTHAAWPAFFVISFVAGQLMLGAGVPFNDLILYCQPHKHDKLYAAAKAVAHAEPAAPSNKKETFYRVHAFLRLHSLDAVSDVERQIAEYKLFRSLAIVFAIDFAVSMVLGMPARRIFLAAAMSGLAFWRYAFLLQWTYRMAFEYFILLPKTRKTSTNAA